MANFSEGPATSSTDSRNDVEAAEDEGKAKRKGRGFLVAQIASVVIGLGVCAFGAWQVHNASIEHENVMNETRNMLASVQKDNAEAKSVSVPSVSEVASAVDEANAKGKQLAEAQNGYQDVPVDDKGKYAEEKVGVFFTEQAQHSRVPWVSRLNVPYKWTMGTALDYDGGKVPCLWVCHADDVLIAYGYGTYDASQGLFDDVERKHTPGEKQFTKSAGDVVLDDGYSVGGVSNAGGTSAHSHGSSENAD